MIMISIYRVVVFSDMVERDEYLVVAESSSEAESSWRKNHPSVNYTSVMVSSAITEIDGYKIELVKQQENKNNSSRKENNRNGRKF